MRYIFGILFTFFLVSNSFAASSVYTDAVGEYQAQVCNTKNDVCFPINLKLDAGGLWTAYCEITLNNATWIYPCYYGGWGVKSGRVVIRVDGTEMPCRLYADKNRGIICIYDKENIITGVKQ